MTREQVIEAVARAIVEHEMGTGCPVNNDDRRLATAALTAVLDATAEPTEEMCYATRDTYIDARERHVDAKASDIWRAMHAALRRELTEEKSGW